MSDDPKAQIAVDLAAMRELVKRVPAKVNNGTYDTTVAFKAALKDANKQIASKSPKFTSVRQARQTLEKFYT